MRTFTAVMVALAVLATAVVSVRLHLHVAQMRYRVSALEGRRIRSEREMRLAQADLDEAKAPRRLMERWAELHRDPSTAAPATPAVRPAPVAPAPSEVDPAPAEFAPDDPGAFDPGAEPRR